MVTFLLQQIYSDTTLSKDIIQNSTEHGTKFCVGYAFLDTVLRVHIKARNSGKNAYNLIIKWQIFVTKVELFCNRKHVFYGHFLEYCRRLLCFLPVFSFPADSGFMLI